MRPTRLAVGESAQTERVRQCRATSLRLTSLAPVQEFFYPEAHQLRVPRNIRERPSTAVQVYGQTLNIPDELTGDELLGILSDVPTRGRRAAPPEASVVRVTPSIFCGDQRVHRFSLGDHLVIADRHGRYQGDYLGLNRVTDESLQLLLQGVRDEAYQESYEQARYDLEQASK